MDGRVRHLDPHDRQLVVITEGADDAATAALRKVSALGNVRSQTLRALSVGEMRKIIAKIA